MAHPLKRSDVYIRILSMRSVDKRSHGIKRKIVSIHSKARADAEPKALSWREAWKKYF
jgi:hypothetical protein